ncbi:hypothetical protein MPSEU_000660200 [Mayamaea pseudoterrestris]|nr:hypothetical protein MPSEU_000660200 [Mayamaea pseudoterrestris]
MMKHCLPLLASLFLGVLTSTAYSECTGQRGVLGACLIVTGNFNINNCTECIKTNLPQSAASSSAATAASTNATDASANATLSDDNCATVDGLLCETLDTCSQSCAGNFCSDSFRKLLVCESNSYVPSCNLTADTCQDANAESGGASLSIVWSSAVMMGVVGTSLLWSLAV